MALPKLLVIENGRLMATEWYTGDERQHTILEEKYSIRFAEVWIKVKYPGILTEGRKGRLLIDIESMSMKRSIMHKESLGHRLQPVYLWIEGLLLDTVPTEPREQLTMGDLLKHIETTSEIDHTWGKGTVWEMLAKDRSDEGDYSAEYGDD